MPFPSKDNKYITVYQIWAFFKFELLYVVSATQIFTLPFLVELTLKQIIGWIIWKETFTQQTTFSTVLYFTHHFTKQIF